MTSCWLDKPQTLPSSWTGTFVRISWFKLLLTKPPVISIHERQQPVWKPAAQAPCWWQKCFLLDDKETQLSVSCVRGEAGREQCGEVQKLKRTVKTQLKWRFGQASSPLKVHWKFVWTSNLRQRYSGFGLVGFLSKHFWIFNVHTRKLYMFLCYHLNDFCVPWNPNNIPRGWKWSIALNAKKAKTYAHYSSNLSFHLKIPTPCWQAAWKLSMEIEVI